MSTDDRVVAMSFENDRFNQGVNSTIGVIGRLKNALNFSGATRGLDDLNSAGQRVDLSHLGSAVGAVQGKFSILAGAAAVALGNIASRAITAGASVVKSFSLDPLVAGFHNYETQIGAVQTIVANTGLKGASGMQQVNAALQDLNTYANKTVYNFSEMARNIGTFTAAGVGLKTSEESIKGIANLAALSGSTSEQASSAMYQLSQAIAAGTVHLQDWNSVVNAGIGGKVFQKALFDTAKAMGTLPNVPISETFEQWEKAGNSFRQSLSTTAKTGVSDTGKLKQAQEDAAKAVADAQRNAADSIAQAAQTVKDAQQGVGDAARQAAKDVTDAEQQVQDAQRGVGDAARQAAEDVKNAADAVKQAQQGVKDANVQASRDIKDAIQAEKDQVKQSALDVQTALDGVIAARERLVEAMKPPSADEMQAAQDKLQTAQLDQADLADAVTRAQEEQTRAAEDLATAQTNLATLQRDPTATAAQIQAAQNALIDAQNKVTDSADAQTRALLAQRSAARGVDQAQQDLTDTQNKGTKADQNVKTAQDALTTALKQYHDAQIKSAKDIADAEQNVKDVRIKSALAQKQAEQNLTDAEQKLADTRIKSAESVQKAERDLTNAERNLTDTRVRSVESQQQAGQRLAQAEHDQAKAIRDAQQSIADAHTQAAKQIEAARASINPTAPKSWLTAGVLTNTLQQFAGDMSTAQLKAQGFTDAQVKQIEALGKTASGAATNIKTFTQLQQALKEEVATAWAAIFKTIFGNIGDATKTFSALHITLENFLTGPIYALNNILKDWAKAGGRTALIDAFKSAWADLEAVLHQVKRAWEEVFPATSGSQLADLTKKFDDFVQKLTPSINTLNDIRRIAVGLFSVLDIGKTVIGDVIKRFADLIGVVIPAGGGFLDLAARVGDFLHHIDDLVQKGDLLSTFVGNLGSLSHITGTLGGEWSKFLGLIQQALPIFTPLIQGLQNLFGSVATFISQSLQNMDFSQVLHAIDVGLLGGIFILFKKFFTGGGLKDILGGGIFGHINEALEGVTGTLKAMQTQLKANALLEIAVAIGILAGSLVLLSTIPAAKLNSAMTAMTLAMASLVGVLAILDKIGSGAFGTLRLGVLALGLIAVAGAVGLLAISVKELSKIDSNDLERGLIAVGVLLGEISIAMKPISDNSAGMISAGLGIAAVAGALIILSHAVKDFGSMNLPTIGKGLAAIGGALLVIGTAIKAFPPGLIGIGLGLLAIAGGIKILVGSIVQLGELKINQLVQGLAGLGGALGLIALAMHSMPPGLALQGAGLVIVAAAIVGIAEAVKLFGSQSMDSIAKGILGMALSLTVLGTALTLMSGTLAGSAALLVAAGAIALLTPALILLGHQDIGTIVTGLAALAGAMTVLGVASLLLEPAAPAMLALGVAMLAVGAAMALVGAGVFLVGTGLSAIAIAGPAAISILLKALESFVEAIPKTVEGIVTALLSIVTSLAKAAPQFVVAIGQILVALGQAVIKAMPGIVGAFGAIVQGALKAIRDNFPDVIKTGLDMLVALLSGIQDHIADVTKHAIAIVTKFLNTLADNLPDIVKAGAHMLVKFLSGIADNIASVVKQGGRIIAHFIQGIADSLSDIFKAGANVIATMIRGIGSIDKAIVKAAGHAIAQFISGVADAGADIVKSATKAAEKFLNALVTGLLSLTDAGAKAMVRFLNGVADSIHKYERQIFDAGWNIAWAIVQGMVQGFADLAHRAVSAVEHLITSLPGKALKLLGISSPSKVFYDIGTNIVQGLTNGIGDNADMPVASVQDMADSMTNSIKSFSLATSNALDFKNPTITPVLDLDQLHKDAATIPGIIPDVKPLTIHGQGLAGILSDSSQQSTDEFANATSGNGAVTYIQNNHSPVSLPAIDIYRQTKNLLSQISEPDASYVKQSTGG